MAMAMAMAMIMLMEIQRLNNVFFFGFKEQITDE
jgi:hypothetical protein